MGASDMLCFARLAECNEACELERAKEFGAFLRFAAAARLNSLGNRAKEDDLRIDWVFYRRPMR